MNFDISCLHCEHCSSKINEKGILIIDTSKPFCDIYGNEIKVWDCDCEQYKERKFDFLYAMKLLQCGRHVYRKGLGLGTYIYLHNKKLIKVDEYWSRGYSHSDEKCLKLKVEDILATDWYEVPTEF